MDSFHSLAHYLYLIQQFAPTYHDYVLYNPSEGDDGARKYRARTFVPTGPEMDSTRRSKSIFGDKLEDIELWSMSSSASSSPQCPGETNHSTQPKAASPSLLIDTTVSPAPPPLPFDDSLMDINMSNYPEEVPAASDETLTRWPCEVQNIA